jgi:DNA repair photolyase
MLPGDVPVYTTPFSVTSQFGFCGLPLRLDTYRGCGFQCSYCFARYRGGNRPVENIVAANPNAIRRVLNRALIGQKDGVVAQFLQHRTPLHFGGMSDPLQPAELKHKVTLQTLQALVRHRYPTVLSTRSTLIGTPPYLAVIRNLETFVVQISFSTTKDEIAQRIEPHASKPSDLLRTIELLSKMGIIVTARWQPYIPGISEEPREFVSRIAGTGCKHLALEHLKLPVERSNPLWQTLSTAAPNDLVRIYQDAGAKRDGRELVLPCSEEKLGRILEVRSLVHKSGLTFGAADNEVQYLSDGGCCCSGVDLFPGFENWFKHQLAVAVKRSNGSDIRYSSIKDEWLPRGSVDRHLNSRSRLSSRTELQGTVDQHIMSRWNSRSTITSPSMFLGVRSGQRGADGNIIYNWDPAIVSRLNEAKIFESNACHNCATNQL